MLMDDFQEQTVAPSDTTAADQMDLDALAVVIKANIAKGTEYRVLARSQIDEAFRRIDAGEGQTTRDSWCAIKFSVSPDKLLEQTRSVYEAKLEEIKAQHGAEGISEACPKYSSHPRRAVPGGPKRGRPKGKTDETKAAEMAGAMLGTTAQTIKRRLRKSDIDDGGEVTVELLLGKWDGVRKLYQRANDNVRAEFRERRKPLADVPLSLTGSAVR